MTDNTRGPINFGATIITTQEQEKQHQQQQPQPPVALHLPKPTLDSPALTPVPSHDANTPSEELRPCFPATSPFYEHPPASHEAIPSTARLSTNTKRPANSFDKDLESGNLTPLSAVGSNQPNPFTSQVSVDCANKECKMWPSKQTLLQTRANEKRQRRANRTCAPLRDRWSVLSKRQRLIFKIVTALFIVGVAVAIGVGISVAVNGSYYSSAGTSKQIPHRR